MPPHCDSMDGPVVKAAMQALEVGDVGLILPYVAEQGEEEVREVFDKVSRVRRVGGDAPVRELAERYFFETVVRIHRAGEGAPYTGLKPAGLDIGPVIPVAARAIESGSSEELIQLLAGILSAEVRQRLQHILQLKERASLDVAHARQYVAAMLGLQIWAHALFERMQAEAHEGAHQHH